MGAMTSQNSSLTIVYSTVYPGADQKKTSKLRVTGLCAGNSPVTGEFPAQMASNVENVSIRWRHHGGQLLMEPTTVGSLWLENDLHENELEFESHMGRSKKNVRVTSDGIHAEIHEIWTCVAPAAPPLCHAAVNPCLQSEFSWRESPWTLVVQQRNLRKSAVTWMSRHYVFAVISRWSTFSSTVNLCNINLCNINCVIFSDTHCSFGPPILWHSPFHVGVLY